MKSKSRLSVLLVVVMIFTMLFSFGGILSNVNTVSAAENYVSDMTWISSTCGSPGYTVQKDKNVIGNPIVIQGVSYTKGIGNHAFNDNSVGADVVVNISGLGYTVFDAYVGIDDGNNSSTGSVVFKVIVDGIEKATTSTLTGSSSAYHLTADVTGGSTLTLRVMNGGDGYSCDWGTWGNAKLMRGSYITKVNCGGSAVDGLSADQAYTPGSWGYVGGDTASVTDTITNNYGYPNALKSVRYGTSFDYKFDVANGIYNVKLYFAENWVSASGSRPMDITINGSAALTNFDPWTDCGAKYKGIEKVFSNISVTDGQIVIHFAHHTGAYDPNSMVSVITVDTDGVVTPTPTPTGSIFNFFKQLYSGSRNDWTGNVGYQFTPSQNITVLALGRPVSGSMNSSHDVKIWRVSDQLCVASATILTSSPTDAKGYKYVTLGSPVTLNSGTVYRITSYETAGGDAWREADSLANHEALGIISYGIFSNSGTASSEYPNYNWGNAETGFNAPTFYVDTGSLPTPTPTPTMPPLPDENWVLNTQDTSITIAIANNKPTVYELKNPSQNYNWTSTAVALPLPTRVKVTGGADYTNATWTYQGTTVDTTNGKKVTLLFNSDQVTGLSIKSVWWASSSSLPGPIQHNYIIQNNTSNAISMYPQLQALDISVKPDDDTVTLWRFNKDRCPVDNVGTYSNTLSMGSSYTASVFDDSQGGGFIPISVLDRGGIHGLYVGWEWQVGRVNVSADYSTPMCVNLKAGYADGGDVPNDRLDVGAYTTFTVPAAYLGVYKGDVDDGTNSFKRWFWNNKVPANMRNDPTEPWTQYGGMFYHWTSPSDTIIWASNAATFQQAAEEKLSNVGFESIEIDNGWWGPATQYPQPSGSVVESPYSFNADSNLWPNGMNVAGPLAHNNGFKFNLYFSAMVNWSNKATLAQKYADYGMDTWRNDFQRPDIATLDWLAANVANYRYETCNGGGTNKDYATYMRASVGTITDDVYPLSLRKAFYDSSYALPPAQLSQCNQIGYLTAGTQATQAQFPYCLRSGMLGAVFPALCAIGPYYNPSNIILPSDNTWTIPIYTSNLTIYKDSLRPLIRDGNVYHILSRPDGVDWDGIEYYNPSNHKGAVMIFKPNSTPNDKTIYFKGLDRSRTYTLTFTDRPAQNTTKTGAQLMDNGLSVNMTGTYVSDIILFE